MVILEYLQSKLSAGQAMSTIRVHASAISAFHSGISGLPIGKLPIISRFLAGAAKTRPRPVVLPTWSLQPILECLTKPPWEPIHQLSLKELTLKTVFLLAITSARRVSELQALSLEGGCYGYITPDILLLRTNVEFMPKCKNRVSSGTRYTTRGFLPPSKHGNPEKVSLYVSH